MPLPNSKPCKGCMRYIEPRVIYLYGNRIYVPPKAKHCSVACRMKAYRRRKDAADRKKKLDDLASNDVQ